MMNFKGAPVSKGIAIGSAFVYAPFKPNIEEHFLGGIEEAAEHNDRLNEVLRQAGEELTGLRDKIADKDTDKAGIFDAHLEILFDVAIVEEILELINKQNYAGEYAVETVYSNYYRLFNEMDDELMRERCADFKDVKVRILRLWLGATNKNLSDLETPSIIFAHDLLPSDTATLDREKVLGIVTEIGGNTSHSAILARSYEIPALLGVKGVTGAVESGETVIVDAVDGVLILEPSETELAGYIKKQEEYQQSLRAIKAYRSVDPVTADGNRIAVCLNIGSVSDEDLAYAAYTDGVGLFRSEFLFMTGKELPGENQQFQVYKKAAEVYGERQVILRTLDIGGDKSLECMELPKEDNPFLGCRALRLCFQKPLIFKTQLKAALRASVYGNLALMFPMVSSMDDLHKAKSFLEECKQELDRDNIAYNKNIPIGIMIEIPSIALLAGQVVREVDFASIGTNDLCQYLLAVDRLNQDVAAYYQSYHPAMFKLINSVSAVFQQAGKPLSICGEMGGDPLAVMAFIGMGIRKFSMTASSIPVIKRVITLLSVTDARQLTEAVAEMNTAHEVEEYLKKYYTNLLSK
jgi:phosphotransferase system enzyme I (PtsI)